MRAHVPFATRQRALPNLATSFLLASSKIESIHDWDFVPPAALTCVISFANPLLDFRPGAGPEYDTAPERCSSIVAWSSEARRERGPAVALTPLTSFPKPATLVASRLAVPSLNMTIVKSSSHFGIKLAACPKSGLVTVPVRSSCVSALSAHVVRVTVIRKVSTRLGM